jgi:dipeptidyl aminopeptidase/acylaminoacyl peptidase
VHGTVDPLVSLNQSELLRDALRAAAVNVKLIPVEGAGHGGFRNPRVNEVVSLFLEQQLLGRDVTVPADPIKQTQ